MIEAIVSMTKPWTLSYPYIYNEELAVDIKSKYSGNSTHLVYALTGVPTGVADSVRDIKFLYFSVKSKKLNVLIYKLIIIIKNRGFIFRLFLVYGQIITRISVLCDLTSVLYIQNFVPLLQIGNLKEKGSKLILTLKDKVPLILGRFLLGTQLTTSSFKVKVPFVVGTDLLVQSFS
ncbi:hypothetical protein Anas_08512 [Armadillidium nasatum]|uniref:Uncharacterized protein n=1 Tax=Armadillidium nasatum TaxID=96803 RepID=A0A5N5SZM2_9CRUS|nr:hypothetical protein Anas_08512 [Armadillidium nasatum]